MPKICATCGRTAISGNSRSHSNIGTRRRQFVNLQNRRVDGHQLKICTSCLKTKTKKLATT